MLEAKVNGLKNHQIEAELQQVPLQLKASAKIALDSVDAMLQQAKETLRNPATNLDVTVKCAKAALQAAEKKDKGLTTAAAAIQRVIDNA